MLLSRVQHQSFFLSPAFLDCLPLAGVKAEEATGSELVTSYYVQSNFSGMKGNEELSAVVLK